MSIVKVYNVIGIMSGTSMDGIDCSYIKTDGVNFVSIINENSYKYSQNYRNKLKKIIKYLNNIKSLKEEQHIKKFENIVTNKFIQVINKFIKDYKIKHSSIDYIGVSGQTVLHDPKHKKTIQLGSCKKIQKKLQIKIVGNFRENDIKNGGQGAPLTPIFHYYLTKKIKKKICFINLGGISNVTYFNHRIKTGLNNMVAFDAGPCCSLIDDWISKNSNKKFDNFGSLARKGSIKKKIIHDFLRKSYFSKLPPKSLDRSFFSLSLLRKLNIEDGAATLNYLVAESLLKAFYYFPNNPELCILSGGGRLNKFLVELISNKLEKSQVLLTEKYNWNGDSIEAYAFAYLSIRKLLNLPITFPKTTGIKKPLTAGRIFSFI